MAARLSENEGASRPRENTYSALTLLDLPLDIIDKICDAIDYPGYAHNLSRTCSSLRHPAQRRLFEEISLDTKHFDSLNTRFDSNPLLPNMIRHLKLDTIEVYPIPTEEESAIAVQKMRKFLSRLSCLRSFALGYLSRPHTWGEAQREVQTAIRDLFKRCEGLEKINLQYLRQLSPDLLDDCAGLRKLVICHNVVDPPVKESTVFARTVHRLDSLKIIRKRNWDGEDDDVTHEGEKSSQFLHGHPLLAYCTPQNGLDLTNLRSLHIVLYSCLADPSSILNICASSLEHLKITAPDGHRIYHPDFTINLSAFASLQTVCLYLYKLPISRYPHYLSTLAPPPSLRSITISTQLYDGKRYPALEQLPALVLSLHALHARSLKVHGNLQKIQLLVPGKRVMSISRSTKLPQRAERYLVWPDRETEGVFEVVWRQSRTRVLPSRTVTKFHRADAPDPEASEGENFD